MDHIQDVYKKKPEMIEKIWDNLTKVNLKVDGKPFQVLYNEEEDELEFHGRSGNETKVGPLISDYERLFSKPINDAIAHIETRIDVFKKYKFLTFEVINEILLLTAIIKDNGEFVNSPAEIDKIAKELDTDVMPALWEGKISEEQKTTIMEVISTGIVPTKAEFIKWVKDLFGSYAKFPKKLISATDEFIEGIVFFFNVDGKIVEYKLVDPSYRQSMKDRDEASKQEQEKNAKYYEEIYNFFLDWSEENAKGEDNNRIVSIQKNFLNMMSEPKIYSKLMNLGSKIKINDSKTYTIQPGRCCEEMKKAIKKHGAVYKNLFEKFIKLFYKGKKRGFVISKEFQDRVNKAVDKFADYSLNEYLIEVNNILMIDESKEDLKTTINDIINNIDDEKTLNKIENYISSLDSGLKDILYNWCWLKYPETKKINNFYKELKIALRSSSGFSEFIEICKSQMQNKSNEAKTDNANNRSSTEINNFILKDENDNSFLKLDFKETIGSFDLKSLLSKKWPNVSNKTWDTIHDISFGPEPVTGKSEILFKTISHPGTKNAFGGDVLMFNNGFEIKDFGTSNAKIGSPKILNTQPIYNFLKLKHTRGIGTSFNIKTEIDPDSLTSESFKTIFIKYFEDKDKNNQIENIIKNLSNTIVDIIKDTISKNEVQKFMNIWGIFYLFCYSAIENFNIFICTSKKNKFCYDYNYVILNDKNADLFNKLLENQIFNVTSIRKPDGWIDISFIK